MKADSNKDHQDFNKLQTISKKVNCVIAPPEMEF